VMNIAKARLNANGSATRIALGDGAAVFDFPREFGARMAGAVHSDDDLVLGIRPEGVHVARQETPGHIKVEAHIIEPLGAYDIVDLKIGGGFLRARTASGFVGKPGDMVWAKLDEGQTHFFDSKSGNAINVRL